MGVSLLALAKSIYYEKFQPGFRDEKTSKILGTSSGAKFGKQNKYNETQKF